MSGPILIHITLSTYECISHQFSSVTQSCWTLCNPMNHNTPGLPVHHQLPESTQTHVHSVCDAIQPSLSPPSHAAFNLSSIRVFSNESALCIRWPKYWIFRVSIRPFSEYSGLISFRIDWFDLLIIQGLLKRLLQHHSLKISVLWCSAFFMIQLLLIRELVPIIWVRELYCAVLSHSVMPDSFLPHRL